MMTARCARWLVAALCICSALHAACAVPKSKFRREIDFNKLKDDWADEESEDWHEDTYEWKKKLEEKKKANVQFDPQNPAAFMEQAQNPGGMQMAFAKLHTINDKEKAEELAGIWQGLLSTDGVKVMVYAIEDDSILLTNDDGKMGEVKTFVLSRPEVEKFTWNSQDYYPPKAEPSKKKSKSKKKGKTKKAKKSTKGKKQKTKKKGKTTKNRSRPKKASSKKKTEL